MRVLVTGSRDFRDGQIVRKALLEVTAGHRGPHTLVHGAARGADTLAAIAAKRAGWDLEAHPAAWAADCRPECDHGIRRPNGSGDGDYCPAAGDYRNQAMVDTGPDLVVAFFQWDAENRGTADCVRRAKAAGIPVRPYWGGDAA